MGKMVGITPLQISHRDVFPNTYPPEKLAEYGRVTLRKAGCSDFTATISSEIVSIGLRAHLDCGTASTSSTAVSVDSPRAGETVEQRLERIRDLQNKGLISEEEAGKARARILNDL